jgi:DNA-binding MarR family transcriptional regulator
MNNINKTVNKIREFNRFYTNIIGLLDNHFLGSSFTLTEVRVLFEIYHTKECTAKKIRQVIIIDEGYLSRIIDRFVKQNLVKRYPSKSDKRSNIIAMTQIGKNKFIQLNNRSEKAIKNMISALMPNEKENLVDMMSKIKNILSKK